MKIGQHPWIPRQEVIQQRHDEGASEGLAHAELQGSCRIGVQLGHGLHGGLKRRQRAIDLSQEAFASFGERQMSGRTVEQPDAEVCLETGDVLADAGRCQAQHPRRG